MKILSTSHRRAGNQGFKGLKSSVNDLLSLSGKVRSFKMATAYIDTAALMQIIECLEERGDKRSWLNVELFIERNSVMRLLNELEEISQDTSKTNAFKCSELLDSLRGDGYFEHLQLSVYAISSGALFHSKSMYVCTTTHHQAVVGSLNLTQNGFTKNEELVVTSTEELNRNTIRGKYIQDVSDYIELDQFKKIGKVVPIAELASERNNIEISSLREILLNGVIWYERKEIQAFKFPLNLPERLMKIRAKIGETNIPYLNSKLDSALPILPLFNLEFDSGREGSTRWRSRLTIHTCFGLWSPITWKANIEEECQFKAAGKIAHLEKIRNVMNSDSLTVVNEIVRATTEIWEALIKAETDVESDSTHLEVPKDIRNRAEQWVTRLTDKLSKEQYLKYLAIGLEPVNVPDVWSGNPSDAKIFEVSMLDSIYFELDIPKKRSLLAQRLEKAEFLSNKNSSDQVRYDDLTVHLKENFKDLFRDDGVAYLSAEDEDDIWR